MTGPGTGDVAVGGQDSGTFNAMREPALLVASLLAPAVQTGLLVWGGLSDEGQAVWNAVAAAAAGLIVAALAVRDRLAPAILGFGVAVLALGAYYGSHLTAAQSTAIISLLTLVAGVFLRTQITAPVTAAGKDAAAPGVVVPGPAEAPRLTTAPPPAAVPPAEDPPPPPPPTGPALA